MGTPIEHANLSVKRFGGKAEDYLPIHDLLDSSKAAHPDLRHRALTHNSWFVTEILERIFGNAIVNSKGQTVSVREIGQFHVMEDFQGYFPSASDFISKISFQGWMDNGKNGERPPSSEGLPSPDLAEFFLREKEASESSLEESEEIPEHRRGRGRGCGGAPGAFD